MGFKTEKYQALKQPKINEPPEPTIRPHKPTVIKAGQPGDGTSVKWKPHFGPGHHNPAFKGGE